MQRLVREGTLIVYFLLALFLLIALVSYSPNDPGSVSYTHLTLPPILLV